jgi:hypothetical protein
MSVKQKLDLPADAEPLDFLKAAFRCDALPLETRLEAAAVASPYIHAALVPVVDLGAVQDRVVVRIGGGLPQPSPVLPRPALVEVPDLPDGVA